MNIKWPGQILDYIDTKEHLLELYIYITNLQQENERLNHQLELQKELTERNRLRKHCYKSRIEKAVEYINNNLLYSEDFDYDEEDNLVWQGARCDTQSEDLLNILNGRSDE